MTTFLQVSDNSRTRCANNALNNTTSPITLNNIDTTSFDPVTTGYIVTIWDDLSYPDPGDDPNMEKAFVSAIDIAVDGSMTLTRNGALSHSGSPKIALLALARHINDLTVALKNLEDNPVSPAGNNSYIQFNDNGIFGGTANLEYDTDHNALKIGQPILLPDNPLAVRSYLNSYSQINHQNAHNGNLASTDYVATADNGTDTSNYVDLGINSSTYNDPELTSVSANDSYLLNEGGDLIIGTLSPTRKIDFIAGGGMAENISATIDTDGINIPSGSAFMINGVPVEGNVIGSNSSVDEDLVLFDGTNGKKIKDSNKKLSDLSYYSNGVYSIPSFTDNGDGSITIGSGDYILSDNVNGYGLKNKYTLSGGTFTLTNNSQNYVIVSYNGGNPVMSVTTDVLVIDEVTIIPVYTVYRNGTHLHRQNWDAMGTSLVNKIHRSIVKTQRYRRQDGLILSEYGTRNINVTAGIVYVGAVEVSLAAINTSTDNLYLWYHSGGNWTSSVLTQYNNSQYDNGTNLVSLNPAKYAVNWVFRGIEDVKHLYVVLGGGDYNLAQAQASTLPTLPIDISSHALLIGRIITLNGASTATSVETAFTTQFSVAPTNNHSDLINRDATGQHPATAIAYMPTGTISATDVQAALTELDTEKSATTHVHQESEIVFTDITTNNVSTSKHGYMPKLPSPTGKFLRDDMSWQTIGGGGDMLKSTYDPTNKNADAFNMDNMVAGTTNKLFTSTIETRLANTSGTNTGDNAVNSLYSGLDAAKQDNITLTTNGSSGAATFDGTTLNIPNYVSSGGGVSASLAIAYSVAL